MNLSEHEIDWIVAEVVRRLQATCEKPAPPAAKPIDAKVITLETLKKHNQPELVVLSHAIVTPAARDELKQRNIRLVRQGGPVTSQPQMTAAGSKLLAANFGADYQAKTLAQLVGAYGANLEQHPATALTQVLATHTERVVRDSAKAIWFTSQPAHAVCLANRHPGVWAVTASDEATAQAALRSVAANVLVIDPQGKSQFTLRKIVEAFAK
jgi:hypothetical protein